MSTKQSRRMTASSSETPGNSASVVFFDPKTERGGGQVVLEDLLMRMATDPDVRLVMPAKGRAKISGVQELVSYGSFREAIADPTLASHVVLVSNANSGMPAVLNAAKRIRSSGRRVSTVAIVHNYPLNRRTRVATPYLLKRFNHAILVEPGLAALRPDSYIPSWLSLGRPLSTVADYRHAPIGRTGKVKSYGRPDRMKGLDLLPAIFEPLTELGYECEVAIGNGFSGDRDYVEKLRRDLAPWLVEGTRNSSWIDPGDVFVIPSRYGEAACLLAQEVLSLGAFAVAGRVGLMPYLSPDAKGMRTFAVDDTASAVDAVRNSLEMPAEEFSAECLAGVALIEHRAGNWHRQTVDYLRALTRTAESE